MSGAVSLLPLYSFMAWTRTPFLQRVKFIIFVYKYSTITRYLSSSPLSGEERRKLFVSYLRVSRPVVPPSRVLLPLCRTCCRLHLMLPTGHSLRPTYRGPTSCSDHLQLVTPVIKPATVGPAISLQVLGCRATLRKVPALRLLLPLFFFRAVSSVVRRMSGYISQRRGTVRTLHNL
jgi:hypothetical protein